MFHQNIKQLFKNFGFQLESCSGVDEFMQIAGKDKSLCWISEDDLRWYLPVAKSESYLSHYKADPHFSAAPQKIEKLPKDFVTVQFPFTLEHYENFIEMIEFIQSGFVDAFYMDGNYFVYPQIMIQDNSVLSDSRKNKTSDLQSYLEVLQESPDSVILMNQIGKIYVKMNDWERAATFFFRCL